MNFWQLERGRCDGCGAEIVKVGDSYYCPVCRDALDLCGMNGTCEGIARNGPYTLIDGVLVEAGNPITGHCDTCGEGWEEA